MMFHEHGYVSVGLAELPANEHRVEMRVPGHDDVLWAREEDARELLIGLMKWQLEYGQWAPREEIVTLVKYLIHDLEESR